jgi:WD40 repeat protein
LLNSCSLGYDGTSKKDFAIKGAFANSPGSSCWCACFLQAPWNGKEKLPMPPQLLSLLPAVLAIVLWKPLINPEGVAAADPDNSAKTASEATDSSGDLLPPGALARLGTVRLRHGEPVVALVFSPDSRTLVSAGGDMVRLWDVATGKELQQCPHDLVCAAAFSRDGKTLASGSGTGTLAVWETATGKQLRHFGDGGQGKVHTIAFSPDGKFLASGTADKVVRLWEVSSGKESSRFVGHKDQVFAVAFSPDGKSLAAGSAGFHLWEVDTGKLLGLFNTARTITSLEYASGGRWLVTADDDRQVRVWECPSGKELGKYPAPRAVGLPSDGRSVALGGEDHTLQHRDLITGKELPPLRLRAGDDDVLALSPDGKHLAAVGSNHTIHLWDLTTGKEALAFPSHQSQIAFGVYATDGAHVTSGDVGGMLRRWEVRSGKVSHQAQPPARGVLAVSADGTTLAFVHPDLTIRLWDLAGGQELRQWRGPVDALAVCGAFSPDGKTLAVGYAGQPLHLWEVAAPAKPPRFVGPRRGAVTAIFLPDGKTLASTSRDGRVYLWDVATGKDMGPVDGVPAGPPLAFSPDGKWAASATENGIISLWEVATGKELRLLQGHSDAVHALAFSPNGRVLASGGADPQVRLWEVASGQELRRWWGHRGPVTAVAFSPDGLTLVSGSTDTTLLLWDVTGGSRGPVAVKLEPAKLEVLWTALAGGDGPRAYDAIWTLAAAPKDSLPFLLDRLQAFFGVDPERLARLIADLDDDDYATRERATAALVQLGKLAEPMLAKTLAAPPSLEVQRRIEHIQQKIKGGVPWPQERLRLARLIGVLEQIGSAEARQGLEKLTQRAPEPDLRQEARAALERLAPRTRRAP